MQDEIAISVDHVYKNFVLPHEKISTIKGVFTSAASKRKKRPAKETQHALNNISFEVKKGEFFGIVGRNGSGKSTMLKILAGIYQPTKGSIETKGKLVPFIELGVGFNSELTGRENVFLNGAMLGFSEKEISAMYDDIVRFAELERFMDQKLKNYSSGMQVRLAFSMATRAEADILLVDEVLAVGDADFQRKCFDYFKSLKKNKKTVVFVSHDMNAVRQYCDRAVLIEDSKLVVSGSSDSVALEYTKMFANESNDTKGSSKQKRWGNQDAMFKSVELSPGRLIEKSKPLTLVANIVAKKDITNLVIGFVVKNSSGVNILGTNTKIQKIETGSWSAKQSKQISWTIPNTFADGNYLVDVAITEEDTITVCDWWEEAASFTSFEENPVPYVASPDIQTKLSEV